MAELSPKHRRFVAEYLKDQNATQAAIRAGYASKNADVTGPRMLGYVGIRAAVDAALKKAEEKAGISVTWVLNNLKEVTERCMTHEPVMEFDYEEKQMVQKRAVIADPQDPSKVKMVGVYEFDSGGANRSLELIGKHLKMFTDKTEHSFPEELVQKLKERVKHGDKLSKSA